MAAVYEAFGRGDVPAILAMLADEVAWDRWPDHHGQRAGVAHLAERRTPAEVAEFFEVIASWTPRHFEITALVGDGPHVAALTSIDFDLPGGGRLVDEEIHLWTVDERGRITGFRHYGDSAKHIAAARGEDTSPPAAG
ncbi:nuclear transport factor 2 family protein [Actinomycetospora soli]|uniref:nuclear transport factor 2 family protein n=1 Tax=Actinomycetospora soli TaxID=2893887 RepID=UPI001E3486CF|nr:nuclear transport factor 2 family protein [Actinomycetospora soli]MCD2187401.1 nuclear transport factor 2 family protein [Actinomycetospora soli]